MVQHSAGSRPAAPGKPFEASVMEAERLTWWLRPVRNVDRVGEHSAVVCHCEYIRPLSASFCSVGILMRPPIGDQAASPVSSYRMIRMFGDPSGARAGVKGAQSGVESRASSLMTPLKPFFAMSGLVDVVSDAAPCAAAVVTGGERGRAAAAPIAVVPSR